MLSLSNVISQALNWLLRSVTQPTCLHDLLWCFVAALTPTSPPMVPPSDDHNAQEQLFQRDKPHDMVRYGFWKYIKILVTLITAWEYFISACVFLWISMYFDAGWWHGGSGTPTEWCDSGWWCCPPSTSDFPPAPTDNRRPHDASASGVTVTDDGRQVGWQVTLFKHI